MDSEPHPRDAHGRRREDRSGQGRHLTVWLPLHVPSAHDRFFSSHLPQNVIEINRPPLPIYQSVIEKTRGLAFRTQALGAAMARTVQVEPKSAGADEAQ